METDRKEFIKQLVLQGKSREETKVQLVSNGYSSEGFVDEYKALISELHMTEPQAPSAFSYNSKVTESYKQEKVRKGGLGKKLLSLLILLFFIALVLWGVTYGIPFVSDQFSPSIDEEIKWGKEVLEDAQDDGNQLFNFTDTLIESKVEGTAISANLYVKRMGLFDGVCKDISVVKPVTCFQTTSAYVLFAPLDAEFYCIDSKGFKGRVTKMPDSGDSCEG